MGVAAEEETVTVRRLATEQELMPYAAGFPPGTRWLVLAPHPDDELLTIGATLRLAHDRGVALRVVIVTDGAAQGEAAVREREAVAAAVTLGLPAPVFWRHPDRSLDPRDRSLRAELAGELDAWKPDSVLVTSPVDLHPDHRALALALHRVVSSRLSWGRRRVAPEWVIAYEVATTLLPNCLVAADGAWEAKRSAARCYTSQLEFRPYDRVMEAMGTLRALTLTGCEHAEAFHVVTARAFAAMSPSRWAATMGCAEGVRWRWRG